MLLLNWWLVNVRDLLNRWLVIICRLLFRMTSFFKFFWYIPSRSHKETSFWCLERRCPFGVKVNSDVSKWCVLPCLVLLELHWEPSRNNQIIWNPEKWNYNGC
ncbi:hypothetical protein TRFO_31925 [Tritrichomonas foetus]|uniref:Uncharacterized protein n=1 Tax=Tritrichomonas foetus TaxID=1144522 RepID=A0A1J4JQ58_9EUKA|nr:hypothetical protein TRFO_31925 [Tritrichomonas foetus]|eukprot:OHT01295.1 hypothetical protein TRFO_31925 [Tritrichomonas foetus]